MSGGYDPDRDRPRTRSSSRRRSRHTVSRQSSRCCGRASPDRGRASRSPARRSSCPRGSSVSATATGAHAPGRILDHRISEPEGRRAWTAPCESFVGVLLRLRLGIDDEPTIIVAPREHARARCGWARALAACHQPVGAAAVVTPGPSASPATRRAGLLLARAPRQGSTSIRGTSETSLPRSTKRRSRDGGSFR